MCGGMLMLSSLRWAGLLQVLWLVGHAFPDICNFVAYTLPFFCTSAVFPAVWISLFGIPLGGNVQLLPPLRHTQQTAKLILHLVQYRTALVHVPAVVQCSADAIQMGEQLVCCLLRDFSRTRY